MINLFYDNFTPDQVCGMYTLGHFAMIGFFIVSSLIILHFTMKLPHEKVRKITLLLAIILCSIEVVKITLRILKGHAPSDWVPLYFCSLFLYASWFSVSKNEFIRNIGSTYIAMGGMFAAITFCLYPSTSLAIYPIWHPESIYSYVYHIILLCTGVTYLSTGYFRPKARDSVNYLIFISLTAIPSIILNETVGTNCLFLKDAYGLAFLPDIIKFSPFLYGILAFLAQGVGLFWAAFGVYKLSVFLINKRKQREASAAVEETKTSIS